MSIVNLTSLDAGQIPKYVFDEGSGSIRVTVVNNETVNIEPPKHQESQVINNTTQVIEKYIVVPEIKEIEKQVIVKEAEVTVIRVPEIVTQIEYREIEKPVYIPQIEIVKIEVPVIQKEVQIIEINKFDLRPFVIIQAITLVILLISHFIK